MLKSKLLVLSNLHPSALFGQGRHMPIYVALLDVLGAVAAAGGGSAFLVAFYAVLSSPLVSLGTASVMGGSGVRGSSW